MYDAQLMSLTRVMVARATYDDNAHKVWNLPMTNTNLIH